jgi:DNA-binding HxlR family transcriptional regulator
MAKKLARQFGCPTEFALEVLGGKWKTVILCYLKQRRFRYGELRRLIPNLSDKVLTERLHDLEARDLIVRQRLPAKGRNEVYVLTPRGRSLSKALGELYTWGVKNAAAFGVQVDNPLARLER